MIRNSTAEFLMFTADSRQNGLEVRFQDETVWLTQKLMAELFQCSTDNISLHLKNIFKDGELEEKSVTEEFSVTASDGKQYRTKHYNLDAIIAIGYRVNSIRATQFRHQFLRQPDGLVLETDFQPILAGVSGKHQKLRRAVADH